MKDRDPFPSYTVDRKGIEAVIRDNGYRLVHLQVPEGMKRGAAAFARQLEAGTGARVWVDGESCYGACDHAGERAEALGADALIHLGHADIPDMDRSGSVPLHFFSVGMKVEMELIEKGIGKLAGRIEEKTIGLATSIQHADLLKIVSELLEREGIEAVIGSHGPREPGDGIVLGCSFHSARSVSHKVSSFLFMGTGRFHPLGLQLSTGRDIWTLDPMTGEIGLCQKDELDGFLRRRYAAIERTTRALKGGSMIGIMIGAKPGQRRIRLAEELRSTLEEKGHDPATVVMDHMDPMKIRSLDLEIVCSTSCPRLAVDDSSNYLLEGITLITPVELRIALGETDWEDYRLDEEW